MKATCEADIRAALKAEGFHVAEDGPLKIVDGGKYCAACQRLQRPLLRVACDKRVWYICPDRMACQAARRGGASERLRRLLSEVSIPEIVPRQPNEEPHE